MTFSERNIVSEYVYENLDHVIWNDNFAPPVLEDGYVCGSNMWANRQGPDNPCVNQESGTRRWMSVFLTGT